ncbi:hypothetical protein [Marinobacter sp.]
MPWVHREDVVGALIWMLESDDAYGPYNVVSPPRSLMPNSLDVWGT